MTDYTLTKMTKWLSLFIICSAIVECALAAATYHSPALWCCAFSLIAPALYVLRTKVSPAERFASWYSQFREYTKE